MEKPYKIVEYMTRNLHRKPAVRAFYRYWFPGRGAGFGSIRAGSMTTTQFRL